MNQLFPLGPSMSELGRGVDPKVVADIGYPLPPGVDGSDERGDRALADTYVEPTEGDLVAVTDATVEPIVAKTGTVAKAENPFWPSAETRRMGKAAIQAGRRDRGYTKL